MCALYPLAKARYKWLFYLLLFIKENVGSEMEEKREQEWKAATREKEGNVKEYWGNHHNMCNWDKKRKRKVRRKRNEKGRKKKKKGRNSEKEEQLMTNLNEAKLMNEENWIETTKFFLLFSYVSAFHSSSIVSSISERGNLVFLFCKFLPSVSSNSFFIFVVYVEEEFEETDQEIRKNRKKDCRIGNETIEEEWKAETQEKRRKKREKE